MTEQSQQGAGDGGAAAAAAAAAGAGGGGAFSLDTAFDINMLPEAHRPLFADAKAGKWSDFVNFAADAATKAKSPAAFSKDMKLDPAAFPPEYGKIFAAKKIENVGALADMAFNGEKLIGGLGENTLARPQAGKLGEWMAANADVLGKPAKPEEYAWNKPKLPDGMDFDTEKEAAFRKFAHERNLPGEMFQDFADFGANLLIAEQASAQQKLVTETTKAKEELTKEWGKDFEQKREVAVFAARNLGLANDVIDKLSGEIGAPHTLRLLQSLGAKMDGASVINGDGTSMGVGKAAAAAKLEAFDRDPHKQQAFTDAGHALHSDMVEEYANLMKAVHGS
jgi:hypothetical protein